jgi:hypothetical protein
MLDALQAERPGSQKRAQTEGFDRSSKRSQLPD